MPTPQQRNEWSTPSQGWRLQSTDRLVENGGLRKDRFNVCWVLAGWRRLTRRCRVDDISISSSRGRNEDEAGNLLRQERRCPDRLPGLRPRHGYPRLRPGQPLSFGSRLGTPPSGRVL